MRRIGNVDISPFYDGKNIKLLITETLTSDDQNKDIIGIELSPDEALALARLLKAATKCKTDGPLSVLLSE